MLFLKLSSYCLLAFVVGTSSSTGVKERSKCQVRKNNNCKSKSILKVLKVVTVLSVLGIILVLVFCCCKHFKSSSKLEEPISITSKTIENLESTKKPISTTSKISKELKSIKEPISNTSRMIKELESIFLESPRQERLQRLKVKTIYSSSNFETKDYFSNTFSTFIKNWKDRTPTFIALLDNNQHVAQAEKQYKNHISEMFENVDGNLPRKNCEGYYCKTYPIGQLYMILITIKRPNTFDRVLGFLNISKHEDNSVFIKEESIEDKYQAVKRQLNQRVGEPIPCIRCVIDTKKNIIPFGYTPLTLRGKW